MAEAKKKKKKEEEGEEEEEEGQTRSDQCAGVRRYNSIMASICDVSKNVSLICWRDRKSKASRPVWQ